MGTKRKADQLEEDNLIPRRRTRNGVASPSTRSPAKKRQKTSNNSPASRRVVRKPPRGASRSPPGIRKIWGDDNSEITQVKSSPRRRTKFRTPSPEPASDSDDDDDDDDDDINLLSQRSELSTSPKKSDTQPALLSIDQARELPKPNHRSGPLTPHRRRRMSPTKRKDIELIEIQQRSKSEPPITRYENKSPGKRKRPKDLLPETPASRRLFTSFLKAAASPSPRKQWDKSAKKKAVRDYINNEDDELSQTILGGASPVKRNLFEILEDQGSKALYLDGSEGYFEQHKSREKISTTKFTDVPDLPYNELKMHVLAQAAEWAQQRASIKTNYEKLFNQWYFELKQGFSLMFYGVGSKHSLLNDFACRTIDHSVLVVNGFNPDTTVREILQQVASTAMRKDQINKLPKTPIDLVNSLINYYQSTKVAQEVTVLIHNIDGEALRNEKDQVILSRLASIKQVHIVASMDHVYAATMFDSAKMAAYRFVWHNVTTFEKYTVETSFDDQLTKGKENQQATTRGAQFVLASLTENSRKLYHLLLCHQMETMMEDSESSNAVANHTHGMESKLLYTKCLEEFLVSNELNYRTMLTEFVEHKMIDTYKDASGGEILYIPLPRESIETMVEELT